MDAREYYNQTATEYDYWKKKNQYYHTALKRLYREEIPTASSVAEIGCATGDILASLDPSSGLGIDISEKMIEIAKAKHRHKPNLKFLAIDLEKTNQLINYQYIVMCDILEHLSDMRSFFRYLANIVPSKTRLIISVANPIWEPILMVAEKLKMKMAEGPHLRLSVSENEKIFADSGFCLLRREYRLLVPKKLPGSDWINQRFYKNRWLSKLGFIVYWVLER